jgi:putative Mn2+ efflux pump MntP
MVGFIFQSLFLGVGLAMDATCVAMTNGLNYPCLKKKQAFLIAFMFGFFQALMPLIGYLLGVNFSNFLSKFIPFIALGILSVLGIKMLLEGLKKCDEEDRCVKPFNFKLLFIQAIATAIDALSVGVIMIDYKLNELIIALLLIMIVTFIFSYIAVYIGKKFGLLLENKANILGGIILVVIGLEIFISGLI